MKTFGTPLVLWLSSLLGLITMLLVESSLGDKLGLLLLCVPLAVLVRYSLLKEPARR